MTVLLLATHNAGKIAELTALLAPYVGEVKSARDLNLPEPEETGTTFHENAALKAMAAARAAGMAALADDSGLCVAALGGAPGVYSARWTEIIPSPLAGEGPAQRGVRGDYQHALDRIFRELNGAPAAAEFVCVLALARPNQETEFFEGRCSGTLIPQPRGAGGFGYDPYFIPDGYDKTFAELGAAVKDKISHRALALASLVQGIGEQGTCKGDQRAASAQPLRVPIEMNDGNNGDT